jgi:hypothetical protein
MKDFTLYPEALELKQLGFEEPCMMKVYWLNSVHKDTKIPFKPSVYLNGKDIEFKYSLPEKHPIEGFGALELNIPTYSQAFRWFREKYDLYADIYRIGKKFNAGIEDMNIGSSKEMVVEGVDYEEAELACLKKLIEIVNEQQ